MKTKVKADYQRWYCPNCSSLVTGVIEYSGAVNVKCKSCGVVMIMNHGARRTRTLTILIPDADPDCGRYYT